MDLNELYYRHQVSIVRASTAASPEARYAHRGLATGYAKSIAKLQLFDGAPASMVRE